MGPMTDIPEVVQRVDDASLREMENVDIDDVYTQMDWVLQQRATPMDLYHRWEKQNWSTQDLDFTVDSEQWNSMTGVMEGIRTEFQRTFTLFFIGEQAVTDTLSPLVHAAPDEPARIFLSTQLVDEARHAVFFSKFFDHVIGVRGGLSAALAELQSETVEGFRTIFDNQLVDATDAVRLDPSDYGKWVEAITIYHLVVEGMLALTGQKYLLGLLREMQMLPGFYAGFTAVARDESRHVNFGVRALMEAGVRDRSFLDRVAETILKLLEPAVRTVAAPDRKFVITPEESPENMRINPYEVRDFSLNSLTKRLRVVGMSASFVDEVTKRGLGHFDDCWAEYEANFGEEHPYRFWERMATTAG